MTRIKPKLELGNVRVHVQVSKTIQIPQFNPYQVQIGVDADVQATSLAEVNAATEELFAQVHNNVMDAANAYVEENT